MNLGSIFKINLKNLMICIDLLLDSWEDRGKREQRKGENHIKANNNHACMHGYYNNFAYKQYFRKTKVGSFWVKKCKICNFFYFALTAASALMW